MLRSIVQQMRSGWVHTLSCHSSHLWLMWIYFTVRDCLVCLCMPQLYGSVWHLMEELENCSHKLALTGSQFGNCEISPRGVDWGDHVLSQVCKFSSCPKYVWNFCLMAKWFLLCVHVYHLHCRLHCMFISSVGWFVFVILTLVITFTLQPKSFVNTNLNN